MADMSITMTDAFRDWLNGVAVADRSTAAQVVEKGAILYAERIGHAAPAPRRTGDRSASNPTRIGGRPGRPPTASRRAEDWLRDRLGRGPVACRTVLEDAVGQGLSRSTIFHAKELLGVVTEGPKGRQSYRLPSI